MTDLGLWMKRIALVKELYSDVIVTSDLTESEKAGYLLAASRIDPRIPELTIEECWIILGGRSNDVPSLRDLK